jgi:hypothetical protein
MDFPFRSIAIESIVSAEMQKGNLLQDCLFGSSVEMATASSNQLWADLEVILNIKA